MTLKAGLYAILESFCQIIIFKSCIFVLLSVKEREIDGKGDGVPDGVISEYSEIGTLDTGILLFI